MQLVKNHELSPHAYADDMQIIGICSPLETELSTAEWRVYVWMLYRYA